MRITELEREYEATWDAYVHNSPASTFYHQLRSILIKLFKSLMWRNVVEKTYKHKPIYLIAKEDSEINGVLPLFLMRSWFFGKKLVSVPFAPYGGVCADDETAERALVEEAERIAKARGVAYLEFRNLIADGFGHVANNSYVTVVLEYMFRKHKNEIALIEEVITMPWWLSRYSARFVIERALVQIQPGAF